MKSFVTVAMSILFFFSAASANEETFNDTFQPRTTQGQCLIVDTDEDETILLTTSERDDCKEYCNENIGLANTECFFTFWGGARVKIGGTSL